MSCDHELANEWAHCSGKNASYVTIYHLKVTLIKPSSHTNLHWRALFHVIFYVMDDICLIGTQGKQPTTKTTRQDSLFTSKHSEIALTSETCVEPTESGRFYSGNILFFRNVF